MFANVFRKDYVLSSLAPQIPRDYVIKHNYTHRPHDGPILVLSDPIMRRRSGGRKFMSYSLLQHPLQDKKVLIFLPTITPETFNRKACLGVHECK